jgi:hypothetical protein
MRYLVQPAVLLLEQHSVRWERLLAVALDFWAVYSEAIQQRMPQGNKPLHSNEPLN